MPDLLFEGAMFGLHMPSLGELSVFLQKYGYIVLFIGVLLEGETILVIAGALAHMGTLSLPEVMLTAWLGSVLNDQGLFFLGHRYGARLLERWPHLAAKVERGRRFIERFGDAVVMIFRFAYGTRTITPILLGINGYPWKRFAFLNIPAALVWAIAFATLGYALGASLKLLLARIRSAEILILFALLLIGVFLYWRYRRSKTGARD